MGRREGAGLELVLIRSWLGDLPAPSLGILVGRFISCVWNSFLRPLPTAFKIKAMILLMNSYLF